MEELFTLIDLLLKGDIPGALALVEELEEMSRDGKISNISRGSRKRYEPDELEPMINREGLLRALSLIAPPDHP